jgi:tetratricopeptide (TPR) repeat protein
MEKTIADLGRLLAGREFESEEEVNAFLQQALKDGKVPESPGRSAIEQAQDLMYRAWDATGKQRVALARQALQLSSDCADAYVLLAEETAKTPLEAKTLFAQGVAAGERALGQARFEEDAGHFWGIVETRPYMRARAGLAECLWLLGERQEAIAHYREMLRLNPSDNQGLRYRLLTGLIADGKDSEAIRLYHEHDEENSAVWVYHRALLLFRQEGAGERADRALREALAQNRHVPAYLLERKRLPGVLPDYLTFGSREEAVLYAAEALPLWQETKGVREWLKSVLEGPDQPEEAR